jgi:type II secretory pathway pseudopilin PulG
MRNGKQHGFTYLSLVILVAIIGLASAATIKLGSVLQRSAAERELLAIGAEYADALESYAKATPPGQSPLPPSFKELLRDSRFPNVRRHLRRVYVDPMTGKAEWGFVYANNAQGGAGQGTAAAGVMPGAAHGTPGAPASPLSTLSAGTAPGGGAVRGGGVPAGGVPTGSASAQPAMQPLQGGTAGIIAIYSLSTAKPVKIGRFPARFQGFENRQKISDWKFARAEAQAGQPLQPGRPLPPLQPGQPLVTPPSEPTAEPPGGQAMPPSPQPDAPEAPPADAQPQRHGDDPAPEEPPQEEQQDKNKTD